MIKITPLTRGQQELIIKYLPWAENISKKYANYGKLKGLNIAELKSSAYVGLIVAAQKYNPERGKFMTFAFQYVKGQILRDINNVQVFENLDDSLNVVSEEQVTNNDEMWETLKNGIDTVLSQRERKIINLAHGINAEPLTFTEIARLMHLSKDKVMHIHKSSFNKLKKYARNNKLTKFNKG